MEPKIRFCTDGDGRRLAYAVHGDGPPVVVPAWWVSHLERDWDEPQFKSFFSALAEHFTVVRYDRSGVGLSDRERSEITLARDAADLEALLDHLGLGQVSLLGPSCGGPIAVSCAVHRPERVDKLVLFGSFACGQRVWDEDLKNAMEALVRAHWGVGAKAIADIFAPDLSSEESRRLARMQREAASPEMAAKLLDLTYRMDVRSLLADVSVPTLVIHRKGERAIPAHCGRDLAAAIPGASLVLLEGKAHAPWFGDSGPVVDAVVDFLGRGARRSSGENGRAAPAASDGNLWQRAGDVWTIHFSGKELHLKHKKGLADLARLLQNPGTEVHALELIEGPAAERPLRPSSQPVLDERARAEYRERLDAIESELAEAEENHDLGRTERLAQEREALAAELASATGLRGRVRALNDPAERARKAVAARIRDSIAAVEAVCPELGAHLRQAVTTGVYCMYAPGEPVAWRT